MAFTAIGSIGTASSNASVSSLAVTTTATAEAGNLVLLFIAADNTSTTDGDNSEVSSITDSAGGNTWTKYGEFTNGQGAAAAGATVSVWGSVLTNQIANGGSITANFGTARGDIAIQTYEFTIGAGNSVSVAGTVQTLADDAADPGSLAISGLTSKEYLFVRGIASESETTTITVTTNFTSIGSVVSSTAGGTTGNMVIAGEFDILTGTGATSDPTVVAADTASVFFALQEAAAPVVASPGAGSGAFTGLSPSLLVPQLIAIPDGALTFSGQAPAPSVAMVVTPDAGAMALTGLTPLIDGSTTIGVPAGSLAFSGQVPVVVSPVTTQEGYRWRNDDGTEATATWRKAQDTTDAVLKEVIVRLRVVIDGSGDNPPKQFQLEFRKVGSPTWSKVE